MQKAGECFDVLGRNQTTEQQRGQPCSFRPVGWWQNHIIILEMIDDDPCGVRTRYLDGRFRKNEVRWNGMTWYGSEWGDRTTMTTVTEGEWPCNV